MIKCAECSHYHDQITRLLCDAGIMDVQMVGGVKVVAEMTQCDRSDIKQPDEAIIVDMPKRGRPAKHG